MLEKKRPNQIALNFVLLCLIAIISIYVWKQLKVLESPDTVDTSKTEAEVVVVPQTRQIPSITRGVSRVKNTNASQTVSTSSVAGIADIENRFNHLSLREFIPHLEQMDASDVRKLGENSQWFRELIESETRLLSTAEYIAMETLHRNAYNGQIERDYEDHFGYPMPPPGYVSVRVDEGQRETIKINTPIARITYSQTEGYEQWENLSETEWDRYNLLNTITGNDKTLWEAWDIEVSDEVVARARELRQPLWDKSWGTHTTPSVSILASYTRAKTADDIALEDQLRVDTYAQIEAEHQQSSRGDHGFHRDDVVDLIREIEQNLNSE